MNREQTSPNDGEKQANEQSNTQQDPPPTLVEWTARAASALLLLLLLGYICWSAVQPTVPTRFEIQVSLDQIRTSGDRFVVPVSVVNAGSKAIERVRYAVWLESKEGKMTDHQTLEMAMMGSGEQRQFEIWFENDPTEGTIQHAAENYAM